MIPAELLKRMVCPETRQPLLAADEELVARLNAAIGAGRLRNHSGQPVGQRLDGALVRADRQRAYPVVDGIPQLLVDEGIALAQLER